MRTIRYNATEQDWGSFSNVACPKQQASLCSGQAPSTVHTPSNVQELQWYFKVSVVAIARVPLHACQREGLGATQGLAQYFILLASQNVNPRDSLGEHVQGLQPARSPIQPPRI